MPMETSMPSGTRISPRWLGRLTGFATPAPSRERLRMRCLPFCQDDIQWRAGPRRRCDTIRSLLSDLGLVWLHIVLPQTLAEELPSVTDDWAEFARTREIRTEIRG